MKFLVSILFALLMTAVAQASTTINCKMKYQADITTSTTSATNTTSLAASSARRCLILENKDAAIKVYVKFGAAHSGTEGIVLQPNARWEALNVPNEAIYLKSASGAPVVGVLTGE